jgi:DNA gyrase subunit A
MTDDLKGKLGSGNQIAAEIIKRPAHEWLPEQYLPFTIYSIRSRALLQTDGLKPVNRRILWSLFRSNVGPNSEHLKAARAAADTVAFHPHGSSSIEDALARMAQGFSLRVPLIDPYGSVGTVSGDTPAAARYWECRLTKSAIELLGDVNDGAVAVGKNFDGKEDEPALLPVRWPVNLINGTQGIAVGYASNMFSHNPDEIMTAARKLLRKPDMTVDELMKIVPGPDLPTGGELFEIDGVRDYYTTGSGRFTIRGRYTTESMTRGKMKITFFELPYQVSAENVITKVRALQGLGKFKEIASIKDLTDKKNGMKLVVETKAGTNHLAVLNELFKTTPLEAKFSVNNTVLVDNHPTVVSMIDLLGQFIEFRKQCLIRRSEVRSEKIANRIHQLDALLAALLDIDKAVAIIRHSPTTEEARTGLMEAFTLDAEQAEWILSMQLRRLTQADSLSVQNEKNNLVAEAELLEEVVTTPEKLVELLDEELASTKKVISSKRRTVISGMTSEDVQAASKEVAQAVRDSDKNLPCYITRFADGRIIKTSEPFMYAANSKKFANSPIVEQIKMKTQEPVVIIGSDGIGRKIPMSYIASDLISKASDVGVNLPAGVKLIGIAKFEAMKSDVGIAIATKNGLVKISKTDFPTRDEFPIITLDEGDEAIEARWLGKALSGSYFAFVSEGSNILIFEAASIRVAGSKSGGVRGMKLKDGESVIHFSVLDSISGTDNMILSQTNQTIKLTPVSEIPTKNKGGQGVQLHLFKKGEEKLTNAFAGPQPIVALDEIHNAVAMPPVLKRAARGVDFTLKTNFGSAEVTPM